MFVAVVSLLYFLVIAGTAVAIHESVPLHLASITVGRLWLPHAYMPGSASVTADRVVRDLNWTLLFSRSATILLGIQAGFWGVSFVAALFASVVRRVPLRRLRVRWQYGTPVQKPVLKRGFEVYTGKRNRSGNSNRGPNEDLLPSGTDPNGTA
jgi:hypothetical protein